MKIGCVKIKNNEFRVGLTPDNVKAYVAAGHHVYMERVPAWGPALRTTNKWTPAASLIDNAADVWHLVDMDGDGEGAADGRVSPVPRRADPLHPPPPGTDRQQMDALLAGRSKAVAYETHAEDGPVPVRCSAPMSQIAGRLSIQEGAKYLEKRFGGEGILLAGVPGTPKANVVILGGGTVGMNACKIAVGMGANVTILDVNLKRLEELTTCSARISRPWGALIPTGARE